MNDTEEIEVVYNVSDNIIFITEQSYLTSAQVAFLMDISILMDEENDLKKFTIGGIAQKIKRSERSVRGLIKSLTEKGILLRTVEGWSVHPEVMIVAHPDRVPLKVVEKAVKMRRYLDDRGIFFPISLVAGKRYGKWRHLHEEETARG
ncbi:hypothetical protein KIH86_08540 [Paenibacillus sp. HN-1]|uniref:hypothetical protein n=1 Tax=Paenibacillus TaxID=44249 RepID=UPI001CA83338|nr:MULTISPECIES: hypothetical protein [Paenibacillus]MBY9079598.1 hypothetical protein [Paenibacillus sp. CGMCC 1.18879]MBY9084287.1 hypothetical protein [Paenibacillus sinensis]